MPPSRLPPDLLERSAPEASRLLALSYVDQIDRARDRLGDALDQEALHDFRVGLRRLRSAIRAYKSELAGSIGGRMRRQLRDLARATNDGRDVEVQLLWLAKQQERLGPDDVPGFFWLVGRLEDRKQKTHDRAVGGVARQYEKVAGKLRKSLGILRLDLTTGPGQRPPCLREVTGGLARRQVARVRDDLARTRDPSDAGQAHRTRISLKRVRYLIEPVARGNRRAGALVRRFKEAQDLLGEHHDMHVLSSAVAALRSGGSASSFAGLEAGLATVARLTDEAANAAFEKFQSVWGSELGNRILARADELGEALAEPPASRESLRAGGTAEASQPLSEESVPGGEPPAAIPPLSEESLRGRKSSAAIPPPSEKSLRGRQAPEAIQPVTRGGRNDGEGQGSARAGRDGDSGSRTQSGREHRVQEAVQAPHRDRGGPTAHHAP